MNLCNYLRWVLWRSIHLKRLFAYFHQTFNRFLVGVNWNNDFNIQEILLFREFTKILLLSETHRRPTCLIRDPSETDMPDLQISTCFIRNTSETNMPFRWPTCLIDSPSETGIVGMRLTYLIRDQLTCLIGDTLETDMTNRSPTRESDMPDLESDGAYRFPIKHVEVSDGSPIGNSVSNRSPIIIIFSWTSN